MLTLKKPLETGPREILEFDEAYGKRLTNTTWATSKSVVATGNSYFSSGHNQYSRFKGSHNILLLQCLWR